MAIFPKIQSPCPYKNNLAAIMDGDICRMCKRQVIDLTDWTDEARVAFMRGCTGEVCVSYKVRVAAAAATAAIALAAPIAAAACDTTQMEVIVGGIRQPKAVQYVKVDTEKALPTLPVVYDDSPPKAPNGKTARTASPSAHTR